MYYDPAIAGYSPTGATASEGRRAAGRRGQNTHNGRRGDGKNRRGAPAMNNVETLQREMERSRRAAGALEHKLTEVKGRTGYH